MVFQHGGLRENIHTTAEAEWWVAYLVYYMYGFFFLL